MKSEKTWIAIVAMVVLVSGFFIFSTLKAKEAERGLRLQKEQEITLKTAEITQLQTVLEKLKTEKADLEKKMGADVASLEAVLNDLKKSERDAVTRVATLTKEKEALAKSNDDNTNMLIQLKKKIDRLEQEKTDLKTKLTVLEAEKATAAESPKEALPDDLAAPSSSRSADLAAPVNLGKIVVQKSTSQAARVEHINPLYGFVIVSAGSKDGLRTDMIVNITRDNRFVARGVIKKLREGQASALLLPEWMHEEVRIGDLVRVE